MISVDEVMLRLRFAAEALESVALLVEKSGLDQIHVHDIRCALENAKTHIEGALFHIAETEGDFYDV